MKHTGSAISLRSIWVDKGPVISLWALQQENVGGEEVRQVLKEIDFSLVMPTQIPCPFGFTEKGIYCIKGKL